MKSLPLLLTLLRAALAPVVLLLGYHFPSRAAFAWFTRCGCVPGD